MAPAFASPKQACALGLLILVILLLPVAIKGPLLPDRKEAYRSIGWEMGPFPYIQQQIFEEKGDIDIAFVGSSHMLLGIDTPQVAQKLAEHLQRPVVVRSICWGGAGFDELYFITRDLLSHRKVRLLVFYNDYQGKDQPSSLAPLFFRYGEDSGDLQGLPWKLRANYYFAAIAGMPRNLLSLVRPNIPAEIFSTRKNYLEETNLAENPAARYGSLASQLGFSSDYKVLNRHFIPYTPNRSTLPQAITYSPETANAFQFSSGKTPPWQLHFAKKFSALAYEKGAKLLLLHIPILDEVDEPTINEPEFWPTTLEAKVSITGIPPKQLFEGMTEDEIHYLFQDPYHLNRNGQTYFTSSILPALIQTYDSAIAN